MGRSYCQRTEASEIRAALAARSHQQLGRSTLGNIGNVLFAVGILALMFAGSWNLLPPGLRSMLSGPSLLEKALLVGSSTRADLLAFKEKGGLAAADTWHNFKVRDVLTNYDEKGTLNFIRVNVWKTFPTAKLASLSNIKSELEGICGSVWEMNNSGNGIGAKNRSGVQCTAIESDRGGDSVEIAVMAVFPEVKQTPPVPASPAKAVQAPPSPTSPATESARNFNAEANAALVFVNKIAAQAPQSATAPIVGKHPTVLLSTYEQPFRQLCGKDYEELLDNLAVASETERMADGSLFGSGMAPHSGGSQGSAVSVSASGSLQAVIVDKDKTPAVRIYGAASIEGLTKKLQEFVSENRN